MKSLKKSTPEITLRETQILQLLSLGFTTGEIADSLYLSQDTVKSHRSNLLQKMKARNSASLVRLGMQYGLIQI